MKKQVSPTTNVFMHAFKKLSKNDRDAFLRELEQDIINTRLSEVTKNPEDERILKTFLPPSIDLRAILLGPFYHTIRIVKCAMMMSSYVSVKRSSFGNFSILMLFPEDPMIVDTLFENELNSKVNMSDFEFGPITLIDKSDPIASLRKTGQPILEWVMYQEDQGQWYWTSL